jgi:hypothetical protein
LRSPRDRPPTTPPLHYPLRLVSLGYLSLGNGDVRSQHRTMSVFVVLPDACHG